MLERSAQQSWKASPTTGIWLPLVVDLAAPVQDVATGGAVALWVTALWGGQPLGVVRVPVTADPQPGPELAEHVRAAVAPALRDHLVRELTTAPEPVRRHRPTGTVVVCTRDRPAALRRCLEGLSRLSPVDGIDLLVVDNGERDDAVRSLAEAHGARWVHEPVPGLDRARNRALMEATGDVVLFLDDDVVPFPTWAETLLRCFDDPLVGAACGLVLPAVLDSEHQQLTEVHLGFGRGFRRRVMGIEHDRPLDGGALGAGASMAVRRELMRSLGGFPELLDGGMPTRSGGDAYGLYRVLRAGHTGVYEPRALSLHWHRDGRDELVRTVIGYSTGTWSLFLHALLHERDPEALPAMVRWARHWVLPRLVKAALGRDDVPPLYVAVADLRGALSAPGAYWRARRLVRARPELPVRPSRRPAVTAPAGAVATVPVSVVVPTLGRRDRVVELVRALDRQVPAPAEVVVVVDGDVDGTAEALGRLDVTVPLRVEVHERNRGAAAARNTGARTAGGELLVFLDDDVLPRDTGLMGAHWRAHTTGVGDRAVVGPCLPLPVHDERPLTLLARNWWVRHVDRLTTAPRLTFTDLSTGNCSLRRHVFESVGGFRPLPRREDWDLGYRLHRAGVALAVAADAVVELETRTTVVTVVRDRIGEGAGDLELARLHPEVAHLLPLWRWVDGSAGVRRVVSTVLAAPRVAVGLVTPAAAALAAVDRLRMRSRAARVVQKLPAVAYWIGVAEGAHRGAGIGATLRRCRASDSDGGPAVPFELTDRVWAAPDPSVARLNLTVRGERVATVSSGLGGLPWSAHTLATALTADPLVQEALRRLVGDTPAVPR